MHLAYQPYLSFYFQLVDFGNPSILGHFVNLSFIKSLQTFLSYSSLIPELRCMGAELIITEERFPDFYVIRRIDDRICDVVHARGWQDSILKILSTKGSFLFGT